jgi:hypothetical protein
MVGISCAIWAQRDFGKCCIFGVFLRRGPAMVRPERSGHFRYRRDQNRSIWTSDNLILGASAAAFAASHEAHVNQRGDVAVRRVLRTFRQDCPLR